MPLDANEKGKKKTTKVIEVTHDMFVSTSFLNHILLLEGKAENSDKEHLMENLKCQGYESRCVKAAKYLPKP